VRRCRNCDAVLNGGRRDRRYCDATCRRAAHRERERAARAALVVSLPLSAELREHELVQAIARAAEQNWRAAAWLLERRYPERWSVARKPSTLPAFDAGDPFAEIDELAERRRRLHVARRE
jgi:hypothetical protein